MTGPDAYVNVGRISASSGHVIVEDVKVSAEGLAIILFEDQIYKTRVAIQKRQAQIRELEQLLREDYEALNKYTRSVEEIRGRRYY